MAASPPLSVRRVATKSDFTTFLTFPWTLYRNEPRWVPPLVSSQRHKLDRTENPSWEHLEGEYFIAWRGDQPVGTIAAFINHRHNDYWDERIGFFGCFEVYDDQEAANALLATAADTVRGYGATALRGPASFSTNDECGLLVEGFEDPSVLLMPYHYPYYQRLMETAPGFEKVMDLWSYYLSMEQVEAAEKLQKVFRITERNSQRRGITIRTADTSRLKEEFNLLKTIYNKAWSRNWGFVPFSDKELDAMVAELGKIFDPRMAFFAEVDGKPVAFLLSLPDFNQLLYRVRPRPGKPEIISLLQLLWHWKIRPKMDRVRIMLMGIDADHRGIGVEAALFVEAYRAGIDLDWRKADGGWVLETNDDMNRLADSLNGQVYKRYRFYQRELTS